MRVTLINTDKKKFELTAISELTLIQGIGAACDAASISFYDERSMGEILKVEIYIGDRLVFNGFCDTQHETRQGDGYSVYIYARSSACILVDSKSQPFSFNKPSARQLFVSYARDKGFHYALPEIICNDMYEVSIGTSCFGAINNFVSLMTGKEIYADAENFIRLREESDNIKTLDSMHLISLTKIINRSEPLKIIHYKKTLSDSYNIHAMSRLADRIDICREDYINLNSLPQWQRDFTAGQRLKRSFNSYKIAKATISGWCDDNIGQRFSCCAPEHLDDYALTEKKYCFNASGETTVLTLKKRIETEEITYVD